MSEPKFTGVWIPCEVLALPLSVSAKIAYGIMSSLDNEDGCYASNGYLATVLSISDRQVRSVISELEDAKLIIRGTSSGRRIIRTVEKDALCKTLGAEENFLPRRKKTSAGGGRKLPTDNIGNNIEDKKVIDALPFSSPDFIAAWNSYADYRRHMKRPLSPKSINEMFKDFAKWGKDASIEGLSRSIKQGWVGVFFPKGTFTEKQTLTKDDHANF